ATHPASALQRLDRSGPGAARHRLLVGDRVQRADRRAAHTTRLATSQYFADVDGRLLRNLSRQRRSGRRRGTWSPSPSSVSVGNSPSFSTASTGSTGSPSGPNRSGEPIGSSSTFSCGCAPVGFSVSF